MHDLVTCNPHSASMFVTEIHPVKWLGSVKVNQAFLSFSYPNSHDMMLIFWPIFYHLIERCIVVSPHWQTIKIGKAIRPPNRKIDFRASKRKIITFYQFFPRKYSAMPNLSIFSTALLRRKCPPILPWINPKWF